MDSSAQQGQFDPSYSQHKKHVNKNLSYMVLFLLIVGTVAFVYVVVNKDKINSGIPLIDVQKQKNVFKVNNLDDALNAHGRFKQELQLAVVGEEKLYGRDFNYILYTFFRDQFLDADKKPEELLELVLPTVINNSVLLQSGQKKGYVKLDAKIFNNFTKDQAARQVAVNDVTQKFQATMEKYSGEIISVWWHNITAPKIPEDQAEALAKKTIDDLYTQIKAGRLTMQAAGDQIKANTALAQIDPSYQGNAYLTFTDVIKDNPPVTYKAVADKIWPLRTGEMTEVIRYAPDLKASKLPIERFFTIIKVTKHDNLGKGILAQFLELEKDRYTIGVRYKLD